MSDISLDRVIEALETFLHANIDVPLVHLNRIEAAFLLDHLRRLQLFDERETRFAQSRHGASVTDCIGWLYLQKRHAETARDTASNMEARMFQAVIDHLQELHGRRESADRAAEAKRREQEEAARRAEAERKERRKKYEEAKSKTQQEWEGFFRDQFGSAYADEMYRAFYGAGFNFSDFATGRRSGRTNSSEEFRWKQDSKTQTPPPPMGKLTWYEILGVSANATKDQIRRAYRKLAALHHPDRPGGSHEKMRDINAARDEGLAGV